MEGRRRRGLSGPSPSSQFPPVDETKLLQAAASSCPTTGSVEPRESRPGGEEAVRSCLQSRDRSRLRRAGSESAHSQLPIARRFSRRRPLSRPLRDRKAQRCGGRPRRRAPGTSPGARRARASTGSSSPLRTASASSDLAVAVHDDEGRSSPARPRGCACRASRCACPALDGSLRHEPLDERAGGRTVRLAHGEHPACTGVSQKGSRPRSARRGCR